MWTLEAVDLQGEWSFQCPQWLARIGRLRLVRRASFFRVWGSHTPWGVSPHGLGWANPHPYYDRHGKSQEESNMASEFSRVELGARDTPEKKIKSKPFPLEGISPFFPPQSLLRPVHIKHILSHLTCDPPRSHLWQIRTTSPKCLPWHACDYID